MHDPCSRRRRSRLTSPPRPPPLSPAAAAFPTRRRIPLSRQLRAAPSDRGRRGADDARPLPGRRQRSTRVRGRMSALSQTRYRHFGSGAVMILDAAGTNPNSIAVHEVRSALLAAGVRGRIAVGAYLPLERRRSAAGAGVVHGAQGGRPDRCGQWPEDLASGSSVEGWKNEALLQLRLRHPIDARGPGRRSARFRPAARARPVRRRHAHPRHRGGPQRPGSGHGLEERRTHAHRRRSADKETD